MIKKNVKIFAAAAILVSLGAAFTSVNAAGLSNGLNTKNTACYARKGFGIKSKLDALVTAGTITQDQETAALKLFTHEGVKKEDAGNFMKTKLDELVKAGTLTQAQETAVTNLFTADSDGRSMHERGEAEHSLKTKLDALVTAGTITQAQETAITNLFTHDKAKEGKENFLKTKLDTLVTAGTITQAQETAMLNSLAK